MRNVLFLIECKECKNGEIDKKDVKRHRQMYLFFKVIRDLENNRAGDTEALLACGTNFLTLLSSLQEAADMPAG